MQYGGGVLHDFIFTEFPFKTVSGDVTAFHRISREWWWAKPIIAPVFLNAFKCFCILDYRPSKVMHNRSNVYEY